MSFKNFSKHSDKTQQAADDAKTAKPDASPKAAPAAVKAPDAKAEG